MSRIPCNVNKDLLPLYVDDVCSEESRELVEEHLSECEDCQNYYDAMKEGIPKEAVNEDKESPFSEEKTRQAAVSVIKDIKKQISNRRMRTIGAAVAVILIFVFVLEGLNGAYMWTPLEKFPPFDIRLKLSEMEVTELYELENGYLYITVEMEAGSYVVSPSNLQPVIENQEETGRYEGEIMITKHFSDRVLESPRMKRCSFIFPLYGVSENEDGNMVVTEDSAICLSGKGGKSEVIWEEGQIVEDAPTSIEIIAREQIETVDEAAEAGLNPGEELLGKIDGEPYVIMWDEKN